MDDMNDPQPALDIEIGHEPEVTIRARGEIDMATSHMLNDAVATIVREGYTGALNFDLSEVTFMDSSGLSVLVNASNTEPEVVVRHASPPVRVVIEATGLGHLLGPDA
jgi:anti-sigma B factor antagonist